uniref:ankyrin repeat domain-containing protein 49-like n=1 Tax=Ciona intestinalis TaxID=7719 RepID=UPI0002B8E511|nr:ankyrin repeat domain-containing protein 49-like [Ciona intestinalis]|eukprot:XP_004225780.1 ankyrin repeat domain-containing protein 49-like [Ciona intestinalis]
MNFLIDSDSSSDDNEEPSNENEKFLWAAGNGKIDMVKQMFESNSDLIKWKDEDGYTAIHRASSEGQFEVIEYLLKHGADANVKTLDGWTPLHCACKWNNAKAATVLLANGAEINNVTNGNNTPLHAAASEKGNEDVLKLLLAHDKVDISVVNDGGDTAYDLVRRNTANAGLFQTAASK